MGPKPNALITRKSRDTEQRETQREERPRESEAEVGDALLQARECLEPPATERGKSILP